MNIIILTSSFPRNKDDYKARWILELGQELMKDGLIPSILCPHVKGSKAYETIDGIEIYRFRYAPERYESLGYGNFLPHERSCSVIGVLLQYLINSLLMISFLFFMFLNLHKLTKKKKAKLIFSNWAFPAGLVSAIYRQISGIPSVLKVYGTDLVFLKRFRLRPLAKYILNKHDVTVAISEYTKACALAFDVDPDRVSVLPVGSNYPIKYCPALLEDLKQKWCLSDRPTIFTVHRLIPLKGTSFLIKAMSRIASIHPDALLVIGGEGPERHMLESLVKSYHLEHNVLFTGPLPNEELPLLYEACDVYVIPSITDKWGNAEGLGMPALEAMSYGKPVVGFDSGGPGLTITDGSNGFKVPEKDWEAMADRIILLLSDPVLRTKVGANGRSMFDKYRWANVSRLYMEVLYTAAKG
ncbi:MAG: glycosyltransferase [Methanomethylovorans sp.]|uniref:glycosyltransferase n=1 Tax=Methanomethylovorans sp. TaxID=2758717 RepID=UPI000A590A9A